MAWEGAGESKELIVVVKGGGIVVVRNGGCSNRRNERTDRQTKASQPVRAKEPKQHSQFRSGGEWEQVGGQNPVALVGVGSEKVLDFW